MMLVESGDMLLDNPVSRFLPEFAEPRVWAGGTPTSPTTRPAQREITIADLLTHTAGLTYGFQFQHPSTRCTASANSATSPARRTTWRRR